MAQVILYPGWQIFDDNGNPAAGAKARFFTAGTSTPVNVFSDSTLVTPHAVPVVADSEGRFPTIYAGPGDYKIKVTDSADVDLFPEVDNWTILTDITTAQLSFPTVTKTTNYTVLAADRGKVLEFDASGGNIIVTLAAATLGAGFPIWIVNSGATGTVELQFSGAETLFGLTNYLMVYQHQAIGITSRGAAGWRAITELREVEFQSTDAGATEAPTLILDRASASPANADVLGALAFQGRSSTTIERIYARIRAVAKTVTNAAEDGLFAIRTILAGTEDDRIIVGAGLYTAGATGGDKGVNSINATTYFKEGSSFDGAKFWAMVTVAAGTPTLQSSFNVTSITDTAVGRLTVTIATDFSSANWCCQATCERTADTATVDFNRVAQIGFGDIAAGSVIIECWNTDDPTAALADPGSWHVTGFGAQ